MNTCEHCADRRAAKRWMLALAAVVLIATLLLPAPALAYDELKNTDPDKYYVLLDLKNQVVTVYERDEAGEYTRIVRRFICTTGRTKLDPEDPEDQGTPTPRGIWKAGARERFGKFAAFGGEYARYWTQIVGGNYFHSIMFSNRTVDTLKSGAYRSLGNNVSHGCVRLYVEDAKWMYYYICPGTTINVSNNEPRNNEMKKALKYSMAFKDYDAFQKKIYDEPELENLKAWVVVDGSPVRTGNGSNDRVLFKLKEGEEVEVLQSGDPWVKVKYNDREGYIKLAYVTYEQGVLRSREDADVIKATAYMYEGPSKDSKPIVKVPTDTSVYVYGEEVDGYTKIAYQNEVGYIKTSALTKGWGTIVEAPVE